MKVETHTALEALQRRLSYVEAIATLCAAQDDTPLGEVVRGIADLLSQLNEQIDGIIARAGRA